MARSRTTRVGRIAEAYLLASIGSGAVIALGFALLWGPLAVFALVVAVPSVMVLALVPSVALIVWAERNGIRDPAPHVVAGAAIGAVVGLIVLIGPMRLTSAALALPVFGLGIAGAVGGWIYHRVASRHAEL